MQSGCHFELLEIKNLRESKRDDPKRNPALVPGFLEDEGNTGKPKERKLDRS